MNDYLGTGMSEMSATEDFLSHYQLQHDPFMARTPNFKFFTPQRKPVLAQLHHMAHFSEQLQVVLGPPGAGKTLLRQALVASCNKDSVQCVVASGNDVSATRQLTSFLCQALNVPSLEALKSQTEQLHAKGMQLYLIVDDAELLSDESLQLLADLSQSAGRSAPRVFLFAQDTIVEPLSKLDMPATQAWLQLIELAPLSLAETRDYLSQRLEGAGQGIELLDDEQVQQIWEQSGGWPGGINTAAREQMLMAVEPPQRPSRRSKGSMLPMRSLIALLLVATGILIAWMMGGSDPEPARTVINLPEEVTPVDVTETPSTRQQLQMPERGVDRLARIAEEEPDGEPSSSDSSSAAVVTGRSPDNQNLPKPVPMPDPAPVAAPEPAAPPVASTSQAAPEPAPAPKQPEPKQPEPKPVARSEPAQSKPVSAPSASSSTAYHQQDWYRQRAASEYTLQLLGTRSRQAAVDFMGKHKAVSDLGFFETVHEGKPWFVVTQGRYTNRTQAQQGAGQLPEALSKLKPWPRSMGSIQQSMR